MSGGKSDKQESTIELPKSLEKAANKLLEKGEAVSNLGFQPNRAVTVAGFTPMQQAAFQNTADASRAFGLSAPANAMEGMPETKMSAGGIAGYDTASGYDEAVAGLPQGYKDYLNGMFINPETGEMSEYNKSKQGGQAAPGKGGNSLMAQMYNKADPMSQGIMSAVKDKYSISGGGK